MKPSFLEYQRLRPWLWRWHRRTGLAAAAIMIVVALTGIALNHTSELSLAKQPISQNWLLNFYGIKTPQLKSFQLTEKHWLTGDDRSGLYLNERSIGACRGQLVGGVSFQAGFIAACEEELLLLDEQGELLEKISAVYGLPVPMVNLGYCENQLCIRTAERVFLFNLEQLAFVPWSQVKPQWLSPVSIPSELAAEIRQAYQGQGLNWERVLLDLHSGRIFGQPGVYLFDVAALLLLFLSLSGFVLWYQQQRKKKQR